LVTREALQKRDRSKGDKREETRKRDGDGFRGETKF